MEFTVPESSTATLAALVKLESGLSHSQARKLIAGGAVCVDGAVVSDPVLRPAPGSTVLIGEPSASGAKAERRQIAGPGFRLLHIDGALLVIDKDPGVVVIPTSEPDPADPPLVARVGAALGLAGHRADPLWVVHRIDRATSGLVLMARSQKASDLLREQFRQREPTREYLAWVAGQPDPPLARLETRLEEDPKTHRVEVTSSPSGKLAVLDYAVQASVKRQALEASRLKVRLVTGRRNQIRAQLSHFGWPLLGDAWYEGPSKLIGRAALHARRLTFEHPFQHTELTFRSPIPPDLLRLDHRLFPPDREPPG